MISKTITALLCLSTLLYCVAGLSVVGNQIVDKNGKAVLLRGVCRPSFEWNPNGESASLSDYQLMAGWGANVVRIALNQDFWLAGSATYAPLYKSTIDQQVAWAKQAGLYIIIDLHWSDTGILTLAGAQQNMADANSMTLWTQVATRYKNDDSVLFELYNEPHDVSWGVWLNGGSSGFTVAGMQQMYNSVRATGATNVVIVGGLNWAFDLSGVSNGYAVAGSNIAYATHPYDYAGKQAADWDVAFGNLAATHPVIMTEFGQYCASNTYVADLLAYAARKGIHWTAWAWYVSGCEFPSIISDWKGTPSSNVGVLVKNHLASSVSALPANVGSVNVGSVSVATTAPVVAAPSASSVSVTPAANAQTIFDDQLANGWIDWSWASVSKTNPVPVLAGSKSISFTLGPYTALYFHTATPFTVGSFSSLQFYVNGGSVNPNNIVVKLYDTSAIPSPIGNILSLPSPVQANQWTSETILLSSFGLASNTLISGVVILYNQNNNGGTIFVDNVSFLPFASASAAATVAASTSTTAKATVATSTSSTTGSVGTTSTTGKSVNSAASVSTSTTSAKSTTVTTAASVSTTSGKSGSISSSTADKPAGGLGSVAGCSISSVSISQTMSNTWVAGADSVSQYNTVITNLCPNQKITALTLSASNWNALQSWNMQASGNQLTLAPYITIAPGATFSSFGYQNKGGLAVFQVTSVTFE